MSAAEGYSDSDRARWAQEARGKQASADRSPFERDRARVLHSAALRRLAAKTQVVAPGESDFPRTRLTHSLECAQIGRELGKALGADPDLVETACLAHDLGHPPFGHTGEEALDLVARECGGFEGNAQSLRILVRLEAKVITESGRSAGLNLTRATLDAATKYPWTAKVNPEKFGVYDDDLEIFDWFRLGAAEGRRCFEAQVMDWADDIAYSVHDLEDAIFSGRFVPSALDAAEERSALFALATRYAPGTEESEFEEALARLAAEPYWPGGYNRSFTAQAALKAATSGLIGRFCNAAVEATRERHGAGPHVRYHADLVVPDEVRIECAVLKAITARYVMERQDARELRAEQRQIIADLVACLSAQPDAMESAHLAQYRAAGDDAARLRAVVDQVASFTDTSARAVHRRLAS